MKLSDKSRRRPALAAALLGLALLSPAPAKATDATFPTGSYTMGSGGWMRMDDPCSLAYQTMLDEVSVSDDTTPLDEIERVFYSGDGQSLPFGPGGIQDYFFQIYYARAGTFFPAVHLTDADGNTTVIELPPVTVLRDEVDPTMRLTLPAAGQRGRISAWRVVRGVVRDAGGDPSWNGSVNRAEVHVLQQRRGRWHTYDFATKRWIRGYPGFEMTYQRWWGNRAFVRGDAQGRWRTPPVEGLTRGRLVVRAEAEDTSCNSAKPAVAISRLVRR